MAVFIKLSKCLASTQYCLENTPLSTQYIKKLNGKTVMGKNY